MHKRPENFPDYRDTKVPMEFPGDKIPETSTSPVIVPTPPNVAPASTVNAGEIIAPLTRIVPVETTVDPILPDPEKSKEPLPCLTKFPEPLIVPAKVVEFAPPAVNVLVPSKSSPPVEPERSNTV
jgi:hypothetical protein